MFNFKTYYESIQVHEIEAPQDLTGWLTPTGKWLEHNRISHALTLANSLRGKLPTDPVLSGYTWILQRSGRIEIECRYDKVDMVTNWLNKSLKEPLPVLIQVVNSHGAFSKRIEINS